MKDIVRRLAAATVGAGALVVATAGLAHAATDDAASAHNPLGTGSGLTGGPTDVYVLKGLAPLPVADPTLGVGTVLPPLFNAVGGLG